MKKLLIIPIVVALYSCNSTYTRTLSTPMYSPSAEINPLRADVDVDMNKRLSGEAQATFFLNLKVSNDDNKYAEGMSMGPVDGIAAVLPIKGRRAKLKSAAAYKAIFGTGADVIVHPNYVVEKHNYIFFSSYKIKVTGFAGTFKKIYQVPYDNNNQQKVDLKLDIKAGK